MARCDSVTYIQAGHPDSVFYLIPDQFRPLNSNVSRTYDLLHDEYGEDHLREDCDREENKEVAQKNLRKGVLIPIRYQTSKETC